MKMMTKIPNWIDRSMLFDLKLDDGQQCRPEYNPNKNDIKRFHTIQAIYVKFSGSTSSIAKFSLSSAADDNSFCKKYCRLSRSSRSATDFVVEFSDDGAGVGELEVTGILAFVSAIRSSIKEKN